MQPVRIGSVPAASIEPTLACKQLFLAHHVHAHLSLPSCAVLPLCFLFATATVQAPTPIPSSYLTTTINTARRQLALGGYRLAAVLEGIFNPAASKAIKSQVASMVATVNAAEGLTAGTAVGRARALRAGRN